MSKIDEATQTSIDRAQEIRRKKLCPVEDAKDRTVEAVVARGRVITQDDIAFTGGATIMLTPSEEKRLRGLGHLADPEGKLPAADAGPRVYQEIGVAKSA